MSHLVIVESPSKSKTISKYLSDDFVVKSSKGHIRDLAISGKGGLGVDIENEFAPHYVISKDKKDVVNILLANNLLLGVGSSNVSNNVIPLSRVSLFESETEKLPSL